MVKNEDEKNERRNANTDIYIHTGKGNKLAFLFSSNNHAVMAASSSSPVDRIGLLGLFILTGMAFIKW